MASLKNLEDGLTDLERYSQSKDNSDFFKAQDAWQEAERDIGKAAQLATGIKNL